MTKLLGKGIDSSLYVGEQCLCDFLKNGIAAVLYSDIRESKALHISEGLSAQLQLKRIYFAFKSHSFPDWNQEKTIKLKNQFASVMKKLVVDSSYVYTFGVHP